MVKNETGERKLTAYERWELPNLDREEAPRVKHSALAVRELELEDVEDVTEEELVYEPLTAQQLEEIRSAAYEEGFIQGESAGYEKGFEEGKEEGLQKGLEEGREAGADEGRTQAHEEALELAQSQLTELESTLSNIVHEFTAPLEESREAVESLLLKTIREMVEHTVETTLQTEGQQLIERNLSTALAQLGEFNGRVKIRLHPDTLEAAKALEVISRLNVSFESDAGLLPGGFIIDSQAFHIDGRIEKTLTSLFANFSTSTG